MHAQLNITDSLQIFSFKDKNVRKANEPWPLSSTV